MDDKKEQDAMPHNLSQQVFPFLADDPLFRREVREERIVNEVTEALQARMSRQIDAILHEILSERLEAVVMEAVSTAVRNAMSDVNARLTDLTEFAQLLADLRFPSDDSADWWKHGGDEE